jgi:hypothetical protein
MSLFDIMGIAAKVPYELIDKLEVDLPKFKQLMALEKEAEPHVTALEPIIKDALAVWDTISPDVQQLIGALK